MSKINGQAASLHQALSPDMSRSLPRDQTCLDRADDMLPDPQLYRSRSSSVALSSSSKIHCCDAAAILNVLEPQLLPLLALGMKVDAVDATAALVEANVVEALKTRAGDGLHPVVRHQEILLPSHVQLLALQMVRRREVRCARGLIPGFPFREATPMRHVNFVATAPREMRRFEFVLGADNFGFEECCQSRMIVGQALYPKVSAEKRLFQIDILDFDLHFISLPVRRLRADKFAAGSQK